jgi:23S rRNA (uracil1939-C5)-methyltransferase
MPSARPCRRCWHEHHAATIVRVAAKGEGATADGRYVALSAPGDMLEADGS